MQMKECTKCLRVKPKSEFGFRNSKLGTLHSMCKECVSDNARTKRSSDSEEFRAYRRRYYASTAGRQRASSRQRSKERYEKDPQVKLAANRKWWPKNREAARSYSQRRREGARTGMDTFDRELSTAYRKAIADDPCFYCGKRAEKMHDDHIYPVSRGGTDHWWNLARACAPCNLSKGTKTAEEFMS